MPSFGTLKADTLTHSTAGSLATNYVVNGSAKVWAAVDGTANSIIGSFNSASVIDDGTGLHRVTFTNSLANDDYATQTSHIENQYNSAYNLVTTGSVRIDSRQDGGTLADISNKSVTTFGDLA
jgi:hypothetical protein